MKPPCARWRRPLGPLALVIGLLVSCTAGAAADPVATPGEAPASVETPAAAPATSAEAPVAPAAPAASAPQTAPTRYVLGVLLAYQPEYHGAQRSVFKARELWAWQRGRFRISTSGAGAVLGFNTSTPDAGAGASADLISRDRLKFGAALRIDNGRRSSDSADLAGIPDVRRTLRGRLYASYTLDTHWSGITSLSQDLLGRGGGAMGTLDFGYHSAFGPNTTWGTGIGLRYGNSTYMGSRYGVTPESSLASGKPVFQPGAGLEAFGFGIGATTAITPRWIAFVNFGAESLRGAAAASPLTNSRSNWQIGFGIGWRNRP